jgi:TetR/AcrR family transcriptional regulator
LAKRSEKVEQNQSEKINKILDATLEVISKKTIDGTRMHLIAKEADVSQAILHYYFKSKNEILISLLKQLQETLKEKRTKMKVRNNLNVEDNIEIFFDQKIDIIKNEPKLDIAQFDYFAQSLVNPELKQCFKEFFKSWTDEINEAVNKETKGEENEMIPYVLVSILMGASMFSLLYDEEFNLEKYTEKSKEMILDVIR